MPSSSTSATSPDRINLLLLTDTSLAFSGGSEQFLRGLTGGLCPEQYDVTLVELSPIPDTSPPSDPRIIRIPVAAIYGPSGLMAYRRLRRLISDRRYDIVQSQHEKSDLLNALLPVNGGTLRLSNRRDMGFKKSPRLRLAFRYLNRRFHGFIAPAREIIEQINLTEGVPARVSSWIPNGVDTDRFQPMCNDSRRRVRGTFGIPSNATVFCSVARMVEIKRVPVLVRAFAMLCAKQPDAYLILVGDGPARGEVDQAVAEAGIDEMRVRILPPNTDVAALLPACDVFVLASASEGQSNALLEGMACGLPAVATAVGGNLQLVDPGRTGQLVPPDDSLTLAIAMEWMTDHPAERTAMGAAARDVVLRMYSTRHMVEAYDALYRRMLASR